MAEPQTPWWELDDDDLPGKLWNHLLAQQEWRNVFLAAATELQQRYEAETDRFDHVAWAKICRDFGWERDTPAPSLNVYRAGIDTAASKLIPNLPAVSVKQYNVPPENEPQATEATDGLNGVMNTDEARDEIGRVVLSALNEGVAWAWPTVADENRVEYQQLQQYQVFWDYEDARAGRPRSLHIWITISRSELLAKWEALRDADLPEHAEIPGGVEGAIKAIKDCPNVQRGDMLGAQGWGSIYDLRMRHYSRDVVSAFSSDRVHMVVSWHLPGGPKATDGAYRITLHPGGTGTKRSEHATMHRGSVLWKERWTLPRFPVVRCACYPHAEGLGALGLGHILAGAQGELDRLVHRVTTVSEEAGDTLLVVDSQWEMSKEDIAGEDGDHGVRFIKLTTNGMLSEPKPVVLQGVNPQDLELIDRYTGQWSLGLAGVSIALSQAQSEFSGNVSGVAQMQEKERQADRLALVERNIGRFVRELAQATLDVIEMESQSNPNFAVVWQDDQRRPRKTKFSDLIPARQDWAVTLEERSIFGSTAAARMQAFLEMGDRQQLPPDLVQAEILRSADLRRASSHVTAAERLVEHHLAQLVDVRRPEPRPDVHTPLDLAMARALAAWRDRAAKGAEETEKGRNILRRIERYLAACKRKQDEMTAQAAPAAAPGAPGFMSATIGDPGMAPEVNAISPTGAASTAAPMMPAAPGVVG